MNITQRYRYLYKPLVFVAGVAPLAWMICGALQLFGASLGADPVKKLEHECGKTALNFLLLTLSVTPVRTLTGLPQLLRLRRMLGLFVFFYAVVHFTVYLVLDLELNFRLLGADIVKRPYITIGFSALLLLLRRARGMAFLLAGEARRARAAAVCGDARAAAGVPPAALACASYPARCACGSARRAAHIEVRICHSSGKNLSSSALAR